MLLPRAVFRKARKRRTCGDRHAGKQLGRVIRAGYGLSLGGSRKEDAAEQCSCEQF
jgi:hypothetical protein